MRKIFLIITSMIILPITLFSYELNFSKNFTKDIKTDLLTSYISVNVQKKDELKVNKEIENFNNFIKENKLVKIKNSSYNLSPRYDYSSKKREFIGFSGNLRFKIETKDAKALNKFIDSFISLKKDEKDVKVNISNISWQVSEELKNKVFDDLRLESIIWVEAYSKSISQTLNKKCTVKQINANSAINRGNTVYARSVSMESSKMAADITPNSSDEIVYLNTNYKLECK